MTQEMIDPFMENVQEDEDEEFRNYENDIINRVNKGSKN